VMPPAPWPDKMHMPVISSLVLFASHWLVIWI
jgi:hypothetical protein